VKKLITTIYNNSVIRYVFFGGCTTLVNLASFYLLRRADVEINIANLISIILAILVCPTAARMGAKPRDSRSGGEFLAALFADFLQVNVGAHLSRNR